jgi:hypothetical protein
VIFEDIIRSSLTAGASPATVGWERRTPLPVKAGDKEMISDAGLEKLKLDYAARAAEDLAYAVQELFKVIEFRIDDPRCELYDVAKVALERYLNRKI